MSGYTQRWVKCDSCGRTTNPHEVEFARIRKVTHAHGWTTDFLGTDTCDRCQPDPASTKENQPR